MPNEADAHLIAAAPDLLAACESLLSCCHYADPQEEAAARLTTAAIAKAKGETK